MRHSALPCLILAALHIGLTGCSNAPKRSAAAAEQAPRALPALEAKEPGALLIENARIHGAPGASALLIAGERIVAIGGPELRAYTASRQIDAGGGLLLPGFHDAHVHLLGGGLGLARAQIDEAKTLSLTLERVGAWAQLNPTRPWVLGRGWSYDIVGKGQFPTAAMLDAAIADRPAVLHAYDGHTAWLNTRALRAANITRDTASPPGGTIVKDARGEPTGALLEDAQALLDGVIPEPDRAEKKQALRAAALHLSSLGITALDAIESDLEVMPLLLELEREGALPMRVRMFLPLETDLRTVLEIRRTGSSKVELVGVKGFVDGVVESKTAFMLRPYEGEQHARGAPILDADRLFPLVDAADAAGLQVLLHAIGDGAVRLSLQAFARTGARHPGVARRHRVEHIEVIDAADLGSFQGSFAMASMQPYHAVPYEPDPDAGAWSENLGAQRRAMSFAWRMLLDRRAPLTFGSDWPVFTANPLAGLAVAATRKNEHGFPPGGWNAAQAITIEEALRAYTLERGEPEGPSATVGALAPGQLADLVVLSPDARLDEPLSLFGAHVRLTVVGGDVVFAPR